MIKIIYGNLWIQMIYQRLMHTFYSQERILIGYQDVLEGDYSSTI